MTSEPSDAELLEFVARFAGWIKKPAETKVYEYGTWVKGVPVGQIERVEQHLPERLENEWGSTNVPDYLHSVDAWSEVWSKVITDSPEWLANYWYAHLRGIGDPSARICDTANATAKERCLALWRALDGKLPEQEKENART